MLAVDTSSIDTANPSHPSTELKSVPCRSCGVHALLRRITRLVSQDNNLCPVIYRTRAACLLPATYYLPTHMPAPNWIVGICRIYILISCYVYEKIEIVSSMRMISLKVPQFCLFNICLP